MAGRLGSLVISVGADIKRLRGDMSRASREVEKATRAMSKAAQTASRAISGIGVAIGAAISTTAFRQAISDTAALSDAAAKLGRSAESLQEFQFAAAQVGVSQNAAALGLQRFTRRVAEAQQGTGELKGILEQYNIALRDSDGNLRNVDDVLADLADTVKNTADSQEQLRIAFKAFDSEGAALVNLLRTGSQGMDQFAEDARNAGAVLSDDLVRAAKELDDRLTTLSFTIETKLKAALLSIADAIANGFETKRIFDFGEALEKNREKAAALRKEIEELKQSGDFTRGFSSLLQDLSLLERRDPSLVIAKTSKEISSLKEELKRVEESSANIPDLGTRIGATSNAQSRISEITAQIKELEGVIDEASAAQQRAAEPEATGNTPATNQAIEAAKKRADAVKSVIAALEFEVEQIKRSEQEQATFNALRQAGVELDSAAGQRIAELVNQREKLQAATEKAAEAETKLAEAASKRQAMLDEGKRLTESLRTEQEKLTDQQRRYEELLNSGAISADTYGRALKKAAEDAAAAAEKTKEITPEMKAASDAAEELGLTFTSAFEDAIVDLKDLKDVFQSLAKDILRFAVRKTITEPLLDGAKSLFPGFFGGARAAGGPVVPGKAFLVGEQGPELFVPPSAGNIVPNGGGGVEVNVFNNNNSKVDVQETISNGRRQLEVLIEDVTAGITGRGRALPISPGLVGR